jgi:two-component system sporulation sensor kinase C
MTTRGKEYLGPMQASYPSEIEEDLSFRFSESPSRSTPRRGAAILVHNPVHQRLVEAAAVQLELAPVLLDEAALQREPITNFELIIADEFIAQRIRAILVDREEKGDSVNPAVVAVRHRDADAPISLEEPDHSVDGFLNLPMAPAQVTAYLSVTLYAHRSFARRYQSAFEELHLNRRIFRSVTSGISIASASSPDLPLVYVNPAFEVMTGYSLEEVQGKNCRFLQGKDRDQPALELVREGIRSHGEVVTVLKNYRKDGTPFWNELYLSPIRNRDGVLTHFVGIQQDVTARVEFEAALRESEKLAAVGRLASSIAHEINNPLESMMNLLYLAQHSSDTAQTRQYLASADAELQRVKLITSRSLRFYKQSTKPQPIRSKELLDSILDLYHSRLTNTQVTVERRERSTQSITCMESEIRQVLNNLISNAIDAMQRTGGRLLIRTREATEWRTGRKGITITIADTGSGMSPDVKKDIYKAFYTTKGIGGTGLGLWISSEIVDRHHGRLIVRSTPRDLPTKKSGTTFQLFLPLQTLPS